MNFISILAQSLIRTVHKTQFKREAPVHAVKIDECMTEVFPRTSPVVNTPVNVGPDDGAHHCPKCGRSRFYTALKENGTQRIVACRACGTTVQC